MKKTTGIVFIFIFLLYICGIELLYSLKISVAKNQSASLIHNHEISIDSAILFSFTPEQYKSLNWSERNKEFTYNKQHYDIISLQFYTDEINVTCYDDSKETSLVDELTGFMKKMFSQNQKADDNNDIASKICKEYLPNVQLTPTYFFQVLRTINANCVLVNQHALIADVWHPPSLV
ncbi:MAG TPA: hypothetical protein VK783_16250 [Bacteroidia bacterium]|jgi:hypothetical protein|nr:hypothetical protein [Bacteroidia bacterium]